MMSLRSCDIEVLTMHDCVNHSLPSLMPIADVDLSPYATQDHRATTETMERETKLVTGVSDLVWRWSVLI